MMKITVKSILPLVFILVLYSCKKEEETLVNEIVVPTGKVWMHLHTAIGGNDVDEYNTIYLDENGRGIKLSRAQFYISDIELVKLNDEIVYAKDILLKTLEEESYLVGDIPVGNYKAIKFKLGLNGDLNDLQPDAVSSGALSDTSMWFNANDFTDGYVYLNAVGEIDTSADLSGKYAPFSYKIGTSTNVVTVNLPENTFPVYEGIISYVHLNADYSKLFQNIDITNQNNLNIINLQDNQTETILIGDLKTNISNSFFSFE
jgi:hypothetical protein